MITPLHLDIGAVVTAMAELVLLLWTRQKMAIHKRGSRLVFRARRIAFLKPDTHIVTHPRCAEYPLWIASGAQKAPLQT